MILTIGGIKGGVGKTTLAVNIAVMLSRTGADVLLIDGDDQGSAEAITLWRSDTFGEHGTGYTFAKLTGANISNQVKSYREKFDHIVIDVGGRDSNSQRAALVVADRFLVPFPPRSLDVDTLDQVQELVTAAKIYNESLQAFAVINKAYPRNRDNGDAAELISASEVLTLLDTPVTDRKAFSDAIADGRAVVEFTPPNDKAIAEMVALFEAFTSVRWPHNGPIMGP